MQIKRLSANPIVTPALDESIGANINGPSLLRVPEWLPNPLGRYYLYFAHHQGAFIRLAYADELTGPWTVYAPGALRLEQDPLLSSYRQPGSPCRRGEQAHTDVLSRADGAAGGY